MPPNEEKKVLTEPQPDGTQTAAPTPVVATDNAAATPKGHHLSGIQRNIQEDHLKEPGTQRMLMAELDRLTSENRDLSTYRDRFNEGDKLNAVLSADNKNLRAGVRERKTRQTILSVGSTLGGALLGLKTDNSEVLLVALVMVIGPIAMILYPDEN